MKRLIQAVFLAGALVFSAWAVGQKSDTEGDGVWDSSKEYEITGEKSKRLLKARVKRSENKPVQVNLSKDKKQARVKRKIERIKASEAEDLVETEAEGVGKCPHCGVKTAEVERDEDTNPDKVAAQVQPSKGKRAKKPPSKEGTDAIR